MQWACTQTCKGMGWFWNQWSLAIINQTNHILQAHMMALLPCRNRSSAQYTAVRLACICPLTAPNSSAKTISREIKTLVLMSKSISILAKNGYKFSLTVHQTLRWWCKQFAWSIWDWINVKYDSKTQNWKKHTKKKTHQVKIWDEKKNIEH